MITYTQSNVDQLCHVTFQIVLVFTAKLYCTSSPCENGGTCEEIENNYKCQCRPGYMGYNCEGKTNNIHANLL